MFSKKNCGVPMIRGLHPFICWTYHTRNVLHVQSLYCLQESMSRTAGLFWDFRLMVQVVPDHVIQDHTPLIIWKNILSQICSRIIFEMHTAPEACSKYAPGAVCIQIMLLKHIWLRIFFQIINGSGPAKSKKKSQKSALQGGNWVSICPPSK